MALTKAQISLVTVSTLGVAAGGYTAQLAAFNTQKEAAAFIATTGLLNVGTNAEFVNTVVKNLGDLPTAATALQKAAFLKALDDGTSRADAAVDFANTMLVTNDGKIASVTKAAASTSTSMDLNELKAEVVQNPLTIKFVDTEKDQAVENSTNQNVENIGKAQIDAGAGKIANDFTFELKGQIGAGDTFIGKFLSPILDSAPPTKSGSQIVIELRNLREPADSTTPLKSLPTEGVAFKMDGVFLLVASDAIHAAQTYSELRDAFEARLAELAVGTNLPTEAGVSQDPAVYAKLVNFKATIGNSFNVQSDKGVQVSGQQIVLTDAAGSTLEPLALTNKSGIIIDTGFTLYAEVKEAEAQVDTKAITTNLDAQNVGYGSQGGSVNLVGQSNSDKGIEELKLTVKDGVWFSKLESKGAGSEGKNHLESIEVQAGSNGYFNVGTQTAKGNTHVVNLKDQQFGDVVVAGSTTKGAGLTDVRVVNAANAGETAINAYVSKNVIARDYNLKDTGTFGSDNIDIAYNLSEGRDVLNLAVDQKVMEAVDTKININTGAGNDVIHFQVTNDLTTATGKVNQAGNDSWLTNQQLLNNLKVDAGDGDDQIVMTGAGNAIVHAGTGNDEVRADNSADRAVFVFNNKTTDITALLNQTTVTSNSDNALSSGQNGVAQSYSLFKATVKVTFQGFESAAIVIDSTDYKTSTLQINQAIKKAIAESPQLSKLLAAHDNAGNALGIESLVDGKLNLSDLNIKITAPADYKANETPAETAARKLAGREMLASEDLLNATKVTNPTATTATVTESDLNSSANSLNNNVYNAEFATTGTSGAAIPEIQTIDFAGISTLPAGHALSGNGATIKIGNAEVKVETGMSSVELAQAAAKALSQEYAKANPDNFVKAEAVGTQVKVYFNKDAADLTATITTTATGGFLSTHKLPTTTVATGTLAGNAAKAAVAADVTLDFNGASTNVVTTAAGNLAISLGAIADFDAISVPVAAGAGSLAIAKAVQEALNGKTFAHKTDATKSLTATATIVNDKVTVKFVAANSTADVSVNVSVAPATVTPAAGTGLSVSGSGSYKVAVDADASYAVSQTLSFAGLQVTESGSITIGNISVSLTKGDNDAQITKKVADALKKDAAITSNSKLDVDASTTGTSVTIKQVLSDAKSTVALADIAISNITAGFANTSATPSISTTQEFDNTANTPVIADGKDSTAESDNVINLGSGTDLVMMGTGANSNDTLVLTGYNQGVNTVVNYNDNNSDTNGRDFLDFTAYGAGKVVLGSVGSSVADKQVAKITLSADEFAKLSSTDLLGQLNGTVATDKQVASLKGIDAVTGGTLGTNYVLMIENGGNKGEYTAYHLTANAGANEGKFANAQTIATLDFGVQTPATVTPVHKVAQLNANGTFTTPTQTGNEVLKGLALTVTNANAAVATDIINLSAATVTQLNNLALNQLTLRFDAPNASGVAKDVVKLPVGSILNVENLTVWGGVLDITAGGVNVTGKNITLNSTLKLTVDQAVALANSTIQIKSDSVTTSGLEVVVNTAADAAKLNAVLDKLATRLDDSAGIAATGTSASLVTATKLKAGGVTVAELTAAGTVTGDYNLVDTAANLAAATVLSSAVDITATDAATVVQATAIDDATNSGKNTYAVKDTEAAILTGTAIDSVNAASSIVITGATETNLTDTNVNVLTPTSITAELAAAATLDLSGETLTKITSIDVSAIAATLADTIKVTADQAAKLTGAKALAAITVTDVTATNLDAVLGKLEAAVANTADDTIDFVTGTVEITAAQLIKINGLAKVDTADTITVTALTGKTVKATEAIDTFKFAAADTGVSITDFTTSTDKLVFDGVTLETASVAVVAATGQASVVANTLYTFADAATADAAGITAALNGAGTAFTTDLATGSSAYFAVKDAANTKVFKYTAMADAGATVNVGVVTADELTLVGTVNGTLGFADFGLTA